MARDPETRQRLLVLGAGPAQVGLLAAAGTRGVETIAVDRDPDALGFALAAKRALVSAEDEPAIDRLALAEHVNGVISPGADWPVGIAARVAERRGLSHPISPATAVLATTKSRQRERLAAAGVPQPSWRAVTEDDGTIELPCVVKAPDRQGQRGLSLVRTREELGPAIAAALKASRGGSCLVEELVDGPEITVNAVSFDGRFVPLTVTDRLTAEPPAFGVALAHAWPSAEDVGPAVDVARRAAEALGIENGPTYTQLRLGPHGPQVVEVAARLGGGHDAELCLAAVGVDLNGLAIDFALGRAPSGSEPLGIVGGACVLFLVPPEGELRAVEGVEQARASDGVLDVHVYRRPGWTFGPLRRGGDRAGAVIATGTSRDDALERARRAAARIRFVVE